MRRVIVHLIRGEVGKYHESITRNLSEKFQTFPIHDRILPHITLKRWFEFDEEEMKTLYGKLEDFAASCVQTNYSLKGFGNFGKEVIYVDAKPSREMSDNINRLSKVLHEITNLTFDEFDTNQELHVTVAFAALKPFDYDQVWSYLTSGIQPDYKMKFDNIAVMKKVEDKWEVDRIWEIKV
ncbi:MAG: hypothetical protein EXS47_01680 [Candidatus Zambryskibacteria bacterium]|nr:hypothetical protein [Candidatus Zambryskibacteria bacterium]